MIITWYRRLQRKLCTNKMVSITSTCTYLMIDTTINVQNYQAVCRWIIGKCGYTSKPVSRLLHCMCRWAVQVYMSLLYYHTYQRIHIFAHCCTVHFSLILSISFSPPPPLPLVFLIVSHSQNAWFDNHYYWSTAGTWDANSPSLPLSLSLSLSLSNWLVWQSLHVLQIYWLSGTWVRNFEQLTSGC